MLKYLKTYLKFKNTFCGIEIAQNCLIVTVLKKKENELKVHKQVTVKSLDEIISIIPKQQAVILTVNNDKVITKTVDGIFKSDINAVNKAFPNINLNDFYYEVLKYSSRSFISICRKDYVESIIQSYTGKNLNVIDFKIGNLNLLNISNYIEDEIINSTNFTLKFKNNILNSIEPKTDVSISNDYNINGIMADSKYLLSLSAAIQLILGENLLLNNFEARQLSLNDSFIQKRFFSVGLIVILSCLLLTIATNIFLQRHYSNKSEYLLGLSHINKNNKNTLLKLSENTSKKEKLVDDLLKSESSKSSFYINAIISNIPSSISLTEINFQPLNKRIKANQNIEINNNTILVSGTTNNSDLFSDWLSDLNAYEWTKKVDVTNYKSLDNRKSQFLISVSIND